MEVVTETTERKNSLEMEGSTILDESAQPPAKAPATPGRSNEPRPLQSAEGLEGRTSAGERASADRLLHVQRQEQEAKALYHRTRSDKAMISAGVSFMHGSPFLLAAMNNPLDDGALEDSDQEEANERPTTSSAQPPRGKSKSKKGTSKKRPLSRKEA